MSVKALEWFLDRATEVFRKYFLTNGPSHDELMERARADVDRLDAEINLQGLSRATLHFAIFNAQDEYK